MNKELQHRLNQIPEKLLSPDFLNGKTLGGDLSFWIFDYAPEHELEVREYLELVESMFTKKHKRLKFVNINLLECISDYLSDRNFLKKAVEIQKIKGDTALLDALKGPLHVDKLVPYLNQRYSATEQDIILINGVGSVWPLLRAHDLLNGLHSLLGHKSVVLFYPGLYTGQTMSLFGKIPSDNYYRAFRLVP